MERWEGQQGCIIKGHEKTIVRGGHAHYLDWNDGLMDVHIRQNLSYCTLEICAICHVSIIPQ